MVKKALAKKVVCLAGFGILVLCALGSVWWLTHGDEKVYGGGLINTAELSDEFMKKYFDTYAEMTTNGEQENMLIVISYGEPDGHGAKEIAEGPNHTYYLMYDTPKMKELAYEALIKDNVVSVEKNEKMELAGFNSWGIGTMGIDKGLQARGYDGYNVKVAVIDTGLDVSRFQDNFPSKTLTVYDVESDSNSLDDMRDTVGHGTHIAGTIAEGTTGRTSIMAIRTVRDEEDVYVSDVNTAIYKAIDSGVDVINLSLGGPSYSTSQKLALDAANAENIIAVAAAGNANSSDLMYPAGYDNTISVAALDQRLERAVWDESEGLGSNYNAMVDYAAPGTNIRSINGIASGTSVATPHVVTAVALLKNYNKDLDLGEVNALLRDHVVDLGEEGKDDYYGYGMVDFNDAEFCDNVYCDEYGVFAVDAPDYARMEIATDDIVLTELNYYSIQNLMLTKAKVYSDTVNYELLELQQLDDLEITGYDAEASGEQVVTVRSGEISTTILVTNPENYESGWQYEVNDKNEILLTEYTDLKDLDIFNPSVTKIYVPESIDGKNVVALSNHEETYTSGEESYTYDVATFQNSYARNQVREVYLPSTVTEIGDYTFTTFNELRRVVMEAEAVRVGDNAFASSSRLATISGAISEMGVWAFTGDSSLEAIELAEGLTTIPERAFSDCSSLEEISIPSTVTSIGFFAFDDATALSRVEFRGNSLTEIEMGAFAGTSGLVSISLPEGLQIMGMSSFMNSGLTSVYIPASVENVYSSVFDGCGNLETIIVNDNNQKYYDVDNEVLMGLEYYGVVLIRGTKYFVIPNDTTRIGYGAFSGVTATVDELVLPDSLNYIEGAAFYGCTGLGEVVIPRQTNLAYDVFVAGRDENYNYVPLDVVLKVYNDSSAYEYAVENEFNYETLDASHARVVEPFDYGDTLAGDTEVEFYYDYGVRRNGVFTNYVDLDGRKIVKDVNELVATAYAGEANYFRAGDTYFVATYKDLLNKDATIRVNVTVNYQPLEYDVPEGLTGKLRENLRTVELPEGFSWMDGTEYMDMLGEHVYLVRFTPENTELYAPVENIEVTVNVLPGRVRLPDPEVTVESKVYDGEWSIDNKYITVHIEGLSEDDYYYYAGVNSLDNHTSAWVSINLTWEASKEYGFGDDYMSYYTYILEDYEVLPAPVAEIENYAENVADVEVVEDGIIMTSNEACTVITSNDEGESYSVIPAHKVEGEDNKYMFEFDITSATQVMVVLKGDGDMDGEVTSADSNLINRSLISSSLRPYRALTALQRLLFDLDGDGEVTSADSNLINRSLISSSLRPYRKIAW